MIMQGAGVGRCYGPGHPRLESESEGEYTSASYPPSSEDGSGPGVVIEESASISVSAASDTVDGDDSRSDVSLVITNRPHPPSSTKRHHDPSTFGGGRPWTLPHQDARGGGERGRPPPHPQSSSAGIAARVPAAAPASYHHKNRRREVKSYAGARQQQPIASSSAATAAARPHSIYQPSPTVVVHPHSTEASSSRADVFHIQPREGSARVSLGRRRRYDSYVSTLDTNELKHLDEELLRRAETGYDEAPPSSPKPYNESNRSERSRKREAGERRSRSVSPQRRREKLCDEYEEEEEEDDMIEDSVREEVKNSEDYVHQHVCVNSRGRSDGRQQHHSDHAGGAAAAGGRTRGPYKQPYHPQSSGYQDEDEEGVAPSGPTRRSTRAASCSSLGPSRVRFHREGPTHQLAPPPEPIFHDPKSGPQVPLNNATQQQQQQQGKRGSGSGGGSDAPMYLSFKRVKSAAERAKEAEKRAKEKDREGHTSSSSMVNWLMAAPTDGVDSSTGGSGRYSQTGGGGAGGGKRTLLHWLDRVLPKMEPETRVARAYTYLSDAIDTRPVRLKSGGDANIFVYRMQKKVGWISMMQLLAVVHLMLALWEPPRALPDSAHYHDSLAIHSLTRPASTAEHLLGLELVLVLIFLLDVLLEIVSLGTAAFFGFHAPPRVLEGKGKGPALQAKLWGQTRLIVVLLFFADICAALNKPNHSPRFSRPLRPLYLICLSETLKRWSILFIRLITQLRDVALGIGIFLGLFSLLGLILFSETSYYADSMPYLNFNNFLNSFVALYVLMTTQNFGALLNPAYTADPGSSTPLYFFFFMAFVLIVVLFLAHLAIPRVYWVYREFQKKQAYDTRLMERLALLMTFRCLDPDKRGWVDLANFRSMLRYARPEFFDLNTGYEVDTYSGATEHMYGLLAKYHAGRIYPHEFLLVCEVIFTQYYPVVPQLRPGMAHPEWYQREKARWRQIMTSSYTELASMVLLLLTCFFLTFYGSPSIVKDSLRSFAYFVIIVFSIEVSLRTWALGLKPYFAKPDNIIDFFVVGAAFFSMLVYGCSPHQSPLHSEQMANLGLLFLILRVVRLFPKCTIFHKFSSAFRVLPFFLCSIALLVLLSYSWAVFGMSIFAKYSNRIVGLTDEELEGWAQVDNFTNFWSASVTLFQVATTYDWYHIMYLWMRLSDNPWFSLYFLAFHMLSNIIVFQLTAALFIDAFLCFQNKKWVEVGEEDEGSKDGDDEGEDVTPLPPRGPTDDDGGGKGQGGTYASEPGASTSSSSLPAATHAGKGGGGVRRVTSAPSTFRRSRLEDEKEAEEIMGAARARSGSASVRPRTVSDLRAAQGFTATVV